MRGRGGAGISGGREEGRRRRGRGEAIMNQWTAPLE